jgi:hypothetical protein
MFDVRVRHIVEYVHKSRGRTVAIDAPRFRTVPSGTLDAVYLLKRANLNLLRSIE